MGCDMWFQTVIKDINEIFGTDVKLETLSAIPRGDKTCTRRLSMTDKHKKRHGAGKSAGAAKKPGANEPTGKTQKPGGK